MVETLQNSWDKTWEDVFSHQSWGKYPDESFIRFMAHNFYRKPKRDQVKVLEVGCGPGANIWYLAREGFDTYGIDGSATAIAQAKERLSAESLKAQLSTGDIIHLSYENNMFDAVGDNECLAHNSTKALVQILEEIQRVLKSGGFFYSRTFSDQVYKGESFKQLGEFEFNNASDGPFGGRGFFRLSTAQSIRKIYGQFFKIVSLDQITYTLNDGKVTVSEWIIVCQK